MLVGSCIWAGFGPIADVLYTVDWWNPVTITGTRVGPEALFTAFGMVGAAAALPVLLLPLDLAPPNDSSSRASRAGLRLIGLLATSTALFFGSFFWLDWNSLAATVLALGVPLVVILLMRPDLLLPSAATAALLTMSAALIYALVSHLTPGWIDAFYLFENTPRILVATLPADDLVLYLVAGAFLGVYYEWWLGGGYTLRLGSHDHAPARHPGS